MNVLEVARLSRLEEGRYVVRDISFLQRPFQKIAIAGATGSGKSTLLKMIAGLLQPSDGAVLFEGERVKGPEEKLLPGHPVIAYLSQHFELRNHYRVKEVLEMANRLPSGEARAVYELCRITPFLNRWTHQLSGGEKQRIALARLLVTGPRLLLLDEPYSNLDPFHKSGLKKVMEDVVDSLNISCILVSHDPFDTLSWADKILILQEGRLVQQGVPEEVYRYPAQEYTAALFGTYTLLSPALAKAFSAFAVAEIKAANPFIRPENFRLVQKSKGVNGEVLNLRFMGSYTEVEIAIGTTKIIAHTSGGSLAKGDIVYVAIK